MSSSTQDFYDTHAEEYFNATAGLSLTPQWAEFSGCLSPGACILDLGSGSGRDLRFFAGAGFQVIGVDYSYGLLKLSQRFSGQPAVLGDLTALPFRDQAFDAVWSVGSLLHIPPARLPHALWQVHRVLRPGGYFFASVKQGAGVCRDDQGRETFLHDAVAWTRLLQRHDFRVVGCKINVEERPTRAGGTQCIEWIETLTRTSPK